LGSLNLAAHVQLRMHDFGQIRGLLSGVKYSGYNEMHCPMEIRRNDRIAGLGNHLGEAQKERDGDYMDEDRRQSHRDEVARGDWLLAKEQVQFGRSLGGDVCARHAFDVRTFPRGLRLLLCPELDIG
jgi:hypothetical protein